MKYRLVSCASDLEASLSHVLVYKLDPRNGKPGVPLGQSKNIGDSVLFRVRKQGRGEIRGQGRKE